MNKEDLEEAAVFATKLIKTAGEESLRFFHAASTQDFIEFKGDSSPVTYADTSIERRLRDIISKEYPTHGIIGEEMGKELPQNCTYAWIIDPIDGTEAFTRGTPLFTNLLALYDIEKQIPLLGCISIPILHMELVAFMGGGCWNKQKQIHISPHASPLSLYLSYDWGKVYKKYPHYITFIFSQNILTRTWADAFAYYLVATSKADLVIDVDCHFWDLAAIYPIITEAGGIMRDHKNQALQWSLLLAGNTIDIFCAENDTIIENFIGGVSDLIKNE